ncbi:hypothetical protein EB093_07410 [bacterium]|nr:hypothetical protein [bacterium]
MTSIVLLPGAVAVALIIMGLWGIRSINRPPHQLPSDFAKILRDGTSAFSKRLTSNVIQILVYLIAVIFIFSMGFDKLFPRFQLAAALIGGLTVLAVTLFQLHVLPKALEWIVRRSDNYPNVGILAQFLVGNGLSSVYVGSATLAVYISIMTLGLKSIIGFTLGVLLTGYFVRLGGGIFRVTSVVGNEQASEGHSDIARCDARNPGTYSEIIGITVGNILGPESDLVTSFLFAVTATTIFSSNSPETPWTPLVPIFIYTAAFMASFTAFIWSVWRIKRNQYSNVFLEGIYITVVLSAIGTIAILIHSYSDHLQTAWHLFYCYTYGLVGAILIGFLTEILTSVRFSFSRNIARQTENGSFQVMLKALEGGFLSNGLLFLFIAVISIASLSTSGPYGLAMAAMGMLSVTQNILNGNFSIPISNAVSRAASLISDSQIVTLNVIKAEQLAGTTVAIRNGFASGAALLSTFALLTALITSEHMELSVNLFTDIHLLVSILLGLVIPYIFLSLIIRGTGRSVTHFKTEIHRQFIEIPFLKVGKAKPDVVRAVEGIAHQAMDTLALPGLIMLMPPIALGYLFGTKALMGFVLGVFFSSFNSTFLWSNLGDSLQQARAYVETGHLGGNEASRFSTLRAADQTGTAYRDLLSPGINTLLKAICMVAFLIILSV